MNSPIKVYASKINFILFGGLASLGVIASVISMETGYLAYTAFGIIVSFPILFTRIDYNDTYIRQVSISGSRTIFFKEVTEYTYGNIFLVKNRKWLRLDLKSYDKDDIEKLQMHIRLRLGKEVEYQELKVAGRGLLLSGFSWRDQDKKFKALIEKYDALPIRCED